MPTTKVQETLQLLNKVNRDLDTIDNEIINDKYTDQGSKDKVTEGVVNARESVLTKKKSLTSFPMGPIRSMNLPLLPKARTVHREAEALVQTATELKTEWEYISEDAKTRAKSNKDSASNADGQTQILQSESKPGVSFHESKPNVQILGTSSAQHHAGGVLSLPSRGKRPQDSPSLTTSSRSEVNYSSTSNRAYANNSAASSNSTDVPIDRKLYHVTMDDEFIYNAVPTANSDKQQSPSNVLCVPHGLQIAAHSVAPSEPSLALPSARRSSHNSSPIYLMNVPAADLPLPDATAPDPYRRLGQQVTGKYHTQSNYISPVHSSRIPDSESRRQYYPHVPPSHSENTIARAGYSGPNPGDRSVSSQRNVQIGESQTTPVQVGVGHMSGSGNYNTGRDGRQHHASPSVWSNMSDPPRAPSSVSIRPSLPAPPRRQRREVETVEAPEALPSSSSQRSSGRDSVLSVGTILSEQSIDSYAAGRRFHWDDKPIMLRDSFIQAEHRRLHSTDQSITWTEENNSSENLDETQSSEYH